MCVQQRIHLTEGVSTVAGPAVEGRIGHHAGTDRIEFDVALAQQQVGLGLHQRGLVATVPQGAGAPIGVVDILYVPAADRDQYLRHTHGLLRREQQVNMIGHQHVGMQLAPLTRQRLTQPAEVGGSVLVFEKARRPVVAALDNVQRQAVDVDARATRHGGILA
jgi:hypothetical protein